VSEHYEYERDPAEIYRQSFDIIRREAKLARFLPSEERMVVRMIHTCGSVDLADDVVFSPGFTDAAISALGRGAPILCDAKMIVAGLTRSRLPANNEAVCMLEHPDVPRLAQRDRTTRSAAAFALLRDRLEGAVVAIGNAPTALFRLLELFDETRARPAAIIGVPVGFVGAAESKLALERDGRVPCLVVRGRRGGSALCVAALNALGKDEE
jgi:precorrin-8X/cobalt-precorrin-8 methylmutase